MTEAQRRNGMGETLAHKVRDARFAKAYTSAMAHFGGRAVPDARERLMAWRKARPGLRQSAKGEHEPGGIGDTAPLPFWTGALRG
jgi:hypothetical protein